MFRISCIFCKSTVHRDSLYGDLDDDISILEGPDRGWGRLFDKQIDVIQTDWPALVKNYRFGRIGC